MKIKSIPFLSALILLFSFQQSFLLKAGSLDSNKLNTIINQIEAKAISTDSIIIIKNIIYKELNFKTYDSNRVMMDLYLPKLDSINTKFPIIFFVHGGGWNAGDKTFSLEKAKAIVDSGFIFVSVNYRFSPNPVELDNPKRIIFPTHLLDVSDALDFCLQILPSFNGDTNNIILMGHSAGGNLVTSLVTLEPIIKKSYIKNVASIVNFDGIGLNIPNFINEINGSYKEMFLNAFGNDSTEWVKASPIFNFNKNKKLPPFLILSQNNPVRIKYYNEFKDSLTLYGNIVKLQIYPNYDHNQLLMKFCDFSDNQSIEYTKMIFNFIKSNLIMLEKNK
jgi:acetyl esterase/lipase